MERAALLEAPFASDVPVDQNPRDWSTAGSAGCRQQRRAELATFRQHAVRSEEVAAEAAQQVEAVPQEVLEEEAAPPLECS